MYSTFTLLLFYKSKFLPLGADTKLNHLSVLEVMDLVEKLGLGRLTASHISHLLQNNLDSIRWRIKRFLSWAELILYLKYTCGCPLTCRSAHHPHHHHPAKASHPLDNSSNPTICERGAARPMLWAPLMRARHYLRGSALCSLKRRWYCVLVALSSYASWSLTPCTWRRIVLVIYRI